MFSRQKRILSFGRNLSVLARVFQPESLEQLHAAITDCTEVTLRGNGRSYGDAALGKEIVDLRKWNKILDFQAETGLITCQSGVLLSDVMEFCIPKGWFLHVTPGIKSITVGGAVASDVHGKNHTAAGNFSRWVQSFQLMLKSGEIINCSGTENSDLFHATFGAMGRTGLVTQVYFALKRITSTLMQQEVYRSHGLDNLLRKLWKSKYAYQAAWLDLLESQDNSMVRFVLYSAEHAQEGAQPTDWQPKSVLAIPFTPPFRCLIDPLMRLYNAHIWRKSQKQTIQPHFIDFDTYFYPLDSLKNWNYLYGPNGFYQYQCCLPYGQAEQGFAALFQIIQTSGQKPYLSVMKKHGESDSLCPNSFPIAGFSLAMDFPANAHALRAIRQMDEVVWAYGGKIYLAKDAASHGRMSRLDHHGLRKWQRGFGSSLFNRIQSDRT
jgi:decaprenylphospho-beta-D-ribofuranose 2-oxidase